jgi:AraC family transcriptional regulator
VTDICFEAGYNSLGTFTRFFTDSIGVCPSSFRKLGKALAGRTVETLLRAYLQRQFAARPGRSIVGTVRGQGDFHGAIFLGVFCSAIPQQRPISGGLLLDQGQFELALRENDRPSFLMAAGFPTHSNWVN